MKKTTLVIIAVVCLVAVLSFLLIKSSYHQGFSATEHSNSNTDGGRIESSNSSKSSVPDGGAMPVVKQVVIDGIETNVEIREVAPILFDSGVGPSIIPPELITFSNLHSLIRNANDLRKLVCSAARATVNDKMVEDANALFKAHPERNKFWVKNLVFLTQQNRKIMYVCFDFKLSPPSDYFSVNSFVWEDSAWRSWLSDFELQKRISQTLMLATPHQPDRFFNFYREMKQ